MKNIFSASAAVQPPQSNSGNSHEQPGYLKKNEFTNRQKYTYSDNQISLLDSTLLKYEVAASFLRENSEIESVIDVGCADGAIGIAIKQNFHDVDVTLATYQPQRVDTRLLKDFRDRTRFVFGDVFEQEEELKKPFDLVLMFAVVHQFLGQQRSADAVLKLIQKLTNKYCIVELAVNNDRRLLKQKQKYAADAYDVLANKETARKWLEQKFDILKCFPIDYGLRLERYIFILKKRG